MVQETGRKARTHRDVPRALTTEQKRQLTARSDAAGGARLAAHIGIVAGFVWLGAAFDGWPGWMATIAQGVAMVFLFTAMHECSHGTAFRTRWMNRAVGALAGLLLFMGPRWFFHFHQDHHTFTQDPGRDPELAAPRPNSVPAYVWHLSGLPSWFESLRVLVGNALALRRDSYISEVARPSVTREARIIVAVHALALPALFMQGWLLEFYLLPLLAGQPFLRAFLLAEHAGCEQTSADMLVNTRTLLTLAPVRFLSWNMSYHTEHHCFPAVPFHRLRDMHAIMKGDLANLEPGYASFHRRFVRALR